MEHSRHTGGKRVCPGHSSIYDSDGCEVARVQTEKEQFLTTNIPLNHLLEEQGKRVYGSIILSKLQKHAQLNLSQSEQS